MLFKVSFLASHAIRLLKTVFNVNSLWLGNDISAQDSALVSPQTIVNRCRFI